jgi:hypothetical protein
MRRHWLMEQLQRQIVVRCCRYAMPWPSLVVGIQRAESVGGLHVWFQIGTRVRSMLVGLLPIPVERPTSSGCEHATPLGRNTESSSSAEETSTHEGRKQFESTLPERLHEKRNFWFQGPSGHA